MANVEPFEEMNLQLENIISDLKRRTSRHRHRSSSSSSRRGRRRFQDDVEGDDDEERDARIQSRDVGESAVDSHNPAVDNGTLPGDYRLHGNRATSQRFHSNGETTLDTLKKYWIQSELEYTQDIRRLILENQTFFPDHRRQKSAPCDIRMESNISDNSTSNRLYSDHTRIVPSDGDYLDTMSQEGLNQCSLVDRSSRPRSRPVAKVAHRSKTPTPMSCEGHRRLDLVPGQRAGGARSPFVYSGAISPVHQNTNNTTTTANDALIRQDGGLEQHGKKSILLLISSNLVLSKPMVTLYSVLCY